MSKEVEKLEGIMTGQIKANYAYFGTGAENRQTCEYTWQDIAFNLNNIPFQTDTAVIVTSYYGHLGWLKSTLMSYRKSGAYVILSYDNSSYIWDNLDDQTYIARHLPRPIHTLLAHSTVMKHKTYDSDKRLGWFWDVKYAQSIIKGFPNIKYVYVTNGDCVIERPEGIKELPSVLGDGDFMSGQSNPNTIHTANMFFKIDTFNKVLDYMTERHKHYVWDTISPENLLLDAVKELDLKETVAEQPIIPDDDPRIDARGTIDYYGTRNVDSTWKKVLGFRNLYHEFEYHENYGLVPDFKKFMDPYLDWIYFRQDWRDTICKYYETKDRRYLMMFWDRGKDSWEDRKFLTLEQYGKEPITDGSN